MVAVFSMFTNSEKHNSARLFNFLTLNLGEDFIVITPKDLQSGCDGCKFCSKFNKSCVKNKCIDSIKDCSVIYIVTPIYFFSLPSQTKMFMDCLYSVDLTNKIFAPILVSGSQFEESGVDLVYNQFRYIDSYCGTITVSPYHKVTFDEVLPLTRQDELGIINLINRAERCRNEINC